MSLVEHQSIKFRNCQIDSPSFWPPLAIKKTRTMFSILASHPCSNHCVTKFLWGMWTSWQSNSSAAKRVFGFCDWLQEIQFYTFCTQLDLNFFFVMSTWAQFNLQDAFFPRFNKSRLFVNFIESSTYRIDHTYSHQLAWTVLNRFER